MVHTVAEGSGENSDLDNSTDSSSSSVFCNLWNDNNTICEEMCHWQRDKVS